MNMQDGETAHQERKRYEEELKKKGQEAVEAGKQTAHSAVREGQEGYEDVKVRVPCPSQSRRMRYLS